MARVDLDSPFNPDELLKMLDSGKLHAAARMGYVAQAGADGKMRFVHYTKARTKFKPGDSVGKGINRLKNQAFRPRKGSIDWGDLTPIVKRTPQERVEHMVERLIEDCLKTGTVPGHTDARIAEITGEYWKAGETRVTGELIKRLVAHYLDEAEKTRKALDDKRVTRSTPDHRDGKTNPNR